VGLRDDLRRRLQAAASAFADPEQGEDPIEPESPPPPLPPEPAGGLRDVVVLVLDSCRFDSFVQAAPRRFSALGEVQRRWSYASWTAPSHYNLLSGLLPHASPPGRHAAAVYREDFTRWSARLGGEVAFEQLLPSLWLPHLLKWGLGYRTVGLVSLPVLNPATAIARDFDEFRLMDRHNEFGRMIEALRFRADRPTFALLNLGETHYPYAVDGQDAPDLPHLHGVHGVARRLDGEDPSEPAWFDERQLKELHQRQVEAVRSVDDAFERLMDLAPPGTWFVVTADHGELFGEGGYFGHGPIQHDKVFEVPFVEGRR
jgi:hypothetical protein